MKRTNYLGTVLAACLLLAHGARLPAAVPTLDAFFTGAQIHSVSISPNGQSLAMIVSANGRSFIAVKDRASAAPAAPILASSGTDSFEPNWCHWANDERVICKFYGRERSKERGKMFGVTRMVALNKDGSQVKQLLEDPFQPNGQFVGNIIDWTPQDPKTVLMSRGGRVVELNIYDGGVRTYEQPYEYAGAFGTDGHGEVRLAWGVSDMKRYYYARLLGEKKWRQLARVGVLSTDEAYEPIAVIHGTNYAYALRDKDGRQALWKIDLADKEDPQLIFASSRVDVTPVYGPDNRVIAALPDTGTRDAYYVDPESELLGEVLARLFKDRQYSIGDMSADMKTVVVRVESDSQPPEFLVLDMTSPQAKLQRVGSRFPGLDKTDLATTERVYYPARDGTMIPAYLTRPFGAGEALTPLIVLPHGGPWARDAWGFDAWVQMLAKDGYTVLQMNYRGSDGYGKKWREASLGDWGGLPYTDTIDGLQWALDHKYGDPKRVCVVGGSFGGFLALEAAVRDSDKLKCAVSVAGVSDLMELESDSNFFANYQIVHEMVGKDPEKLKAASPRLHADRIAVPVLLVHGTEDFTVEPDQSQFMAKAMTAANKPFKLVMIEHTDHYFQNPQPQRELFENITAFLRECL